jgi:hypothetical protein
LPLLDSMVPAQTPLDKTAAAPAGASSASGIRTARRPATGARLQEGRDFEFSFITKPLEPFRNRVTLITGMDMPEAMATTEEPGGDHARGAVLLSGARPRRNAVSPYLGVTIDQLIAKEVRPGHDSLNRFRSAWKKTATSATATGATAAPIPTASPGLRPQPLPTEVNPRVAFERCSATAQSGRAASGQKAERQHPRFGDPGDRVLQEAAGRGRSRRLDTYLENIREIERRIRIAMEATVKEPSEEIPFGLPKTNTSITG